MPYRTGRDSEIGKVALDELDVRHVRQIGALARDEAVHDADAFAAAAQFFTEMRSDEPRAASNKIVGHFTFRFNGPPSTG